jgi:hypothetical protein
MGLEGEVGRINTILALQVTGRTGNRPNDVLSTRYWKVFNAGHTERSVQTLEDVCPIVLVSVYDLHVPYRTPSRSILLGLSLHRTQ